MYPLFIIVGLMTVSFLSGKLPVDLTALLALFAIASLGYLTPQEALSGFSSGTVITMVATFFVTAALRRTGVTNLIGTALSSVAGRSERRNILVVVAAASFVSSFMNNLAATALLLPAVITLSRRSGINGSKLLMPLSFGTILGGMNTLIGTTPNLLANDVLRQRGYVPFSFLEFAPFGLSMCIIGGLFMAQWGRKFLPHRASGEAADDDRNFLSLYRLEERLFRLRVPSNSPIHNRTLKDVRFAQTLGAVVDVILRKGSRIESPSGSEVLLEGDELIVQGRPYEFESMSKFRGARILSSDSHAATYDSSTLSRIALRIKNPSFYQKRLYDLKLREQFGVAIVGLERAGSIISEVLDLVKLEEADLLFVVGDSESISKLKNDISYEIVTTPHSLDEFYSGRLPLIQLPLETALHGVSVRDTALGHLVGVNIIAVVRGGKFLTQNLPDMVLHRGDQLLLSADTKHIERLLWLSELMMQSKRERFGATSSRYGLVEVVLAPRSWLIGKTIAEVLFREKFQFRVLAIWRRGKPIRARLSQTALEFGDTLLLYGDREKFPLLRKDTNFVVLSPTEESVVQGKKAPIAIGALLILVLLSALGIQSVELSAMFAALLVVLTRCISMEEGYKNVEWRIITLVSALLPITLAIENTHILENYIKDLVSISGHDSIWLPLIILCVGASILSQALDNTVAVALLVPIGLRAAEQAHVSPHMFAMAITLSASIVFMTPVSHRANLLVMGAGGYRTRDYLKLGTCLSIICLVLILLVAGLYYGVSF